MLLSYIFGPSVIKYDILRNNGAVSYKQLHTAYSYLASHADVLRFLSRVFSRTWGEEMRDETLRMSAWEANSYQKLDLFQIVPGSTLQLRLKNYSQWVYLLPVGIPYLKNLVSNKLTKI